MEIVWNGKETKPTPKQCRDNDNKFIAWDGKNRYVTYFDGYDNVFRVPVDTGGVRRMVPDTEIRMWTEFPYPPMQ